MKANVKKILWALAFKPRNIILKRQISKNQKFKIPSLFCWLTTAWFAKKPAIFSSSYLINHFLCLLFIIQSFANTRKNWDLLLHGALLMRNGDIKTKINAYFVLIRVYMRTKLYAGTMLKISKEKNTSIIVSYIMLWPVFHFFVFCTFKSVWECLDYGDASHLSKKEKKSKKLLRISCIIAIKPCEQYQIIGRPALVFLRKI